jgi:hypothetical protein
MQKKILLETFNKKQIYVTEWICTKCGDKEMDIQEAIRVQRCLQPPLAERISLLLSYPAEVFRKIVW